MIVTNKFNNMSFNLPYYSGISKAIKNGRNPYEGYQRGMGLQFGDLKEKILNDSLYREAFHASSSRSLVSENNRMNIFLIMKFFLEKIPFGNIVEFGSYRGGSAIFHTTGHFQKSAEKARYWV